ncbi:hypothetical protein Pyrfu_0773 [Pyrolobus fumarii 1A]|uniref:Uncharacterized protein n=1 Tax=Pyrolobus fumarii (strain DSM 11204 / 1A) TaxID=694429 RepID=G0EDF7_PYRF1|nr:hypothetical protein [Pyrolobus fumarii]AEM38642.1 hypothetical protein Pyrfu_0773 [Pyrolobus fumarii 1A]
MGEAMSGISGKETVQLRLVNVIIAAYQYALHKTLGSSSGAMTQLLITNLGDELVHMLEETGVSITAETDPADAISNALRELGIAKHVEVVKPETQSVGEEYIIKVYDSVFREIPKFLAKLGVKYTLSPEALLVAAIIRAYLRKKDPNARVNVTVDEYAPDKPLTIRVKILRALKT